MSQSSFRAHSPREMRLRRKQIPQSNPLEFVNGAKVAHIYSALKNSLILNSSTLLENILAIINAGGFAKTYTNPNCET